MSQIRHHRGRAIPLGFMLADTVAYSEGHAAKTRAVCLGSSGVVSSNAPRDWYTFETSQTHITSSPSPASREASSCTPSYDCSFLSASVHSQHQTHDGAGACIDGADCSCGGTCSCGCCSSRNSRHASSTQKQCEQEKGGREEEKSTTTASNVRRRARRTRGNPEVGSRAGVAVARQATERLHVIAAQLVSGNGSSSSSSKVQGKSGLQSVENEDMILSSLSAANNPSLSDLLGPSAGGLSAASILLPTGVPQVQLSDVAGSAGARARACTEKGCSTEDSTTGKASATRPAAVMGASAKLPTRFGDFTIVAFECEVPGIETGAVVKGDIRGKEAVPVRLHSACFTGDLMGSLRCDCRDQLEAALLQIGDPSEECGAVIYLQQEGRGIGLGNKIKAYALQDEGMDTVEANHALGFADDLRTYECAAAIVKALGCKSITLLSNNPKKKRGMETNGVRVAAMRPLITPPNPHNKAYLETKKAKSGHLL